MPLPMYTVPADAEPLYTAVQLLRVAVIMLDVLFRNTQKAPADNPDVAFDKMVKGVPDVML